MSVDRGIDVALADWQAGFPSEESSWVAAGECIRTVPGTVPAGRLATVPKRFERLIGKGVVQGGASVSSRIGLEGLVPLGRRKLDSYGGMAGDGCRRGRQRR
jgi:hypothetical protein